MSGGFRVGNLDTGGFRVGTCLAGGLGLLLYRGLGPVWTAENTKVRCGTTHLESLNLTLPPQTPPGEELNQDPRCTVGKTHTHTKKKKLTP